MKALKTLERIGKATEELRSIVAMLLKEEQVRSSSEAKEISRRTLREPAKKEITKETPDAEAADNADLLISEVAELLGKPINERSARKNSILVSEEDPRNHGDWSSGKPAREVTEHCDGASRRRGFWFSLSHQRIRI